LEPHASVPISEQLNKSATISPNFTSPQLNSMLPNKPPGVQLQIISNAPGAQFSVPTQQQPQQQQSYNVQAPGPNGANNVRPNLPAFSVQQQQSLQQLQQPGQNQDQDDPELFSLLDTFIDEDLNNDTIQGSSTSEAGYGNESQAITQIRRELEFGFETNDLQKMAPGLRQGPSTAAPQQGQGQLMYLMNNGQQVQVQQPGQQQGPQQIPMQQFATVSANGQVIGQGQFAGYQQGQQHPQGQQVFAQNAPNFQPQVS